MNIVDRVFIAAACVAIVVQCLFSVGRQQSEKRETLKCSVVRVVRDDTDEPVLDERHERPYTVLHYKPSWVVFSVPGDLGDPDTDVYVTPPVTE